MKIVPTETDDEICLHFISEGSGLIAHESVTELALSIIENVPNKRVVFDLAQVPYTTSPLLAVLIMVEKELMPERLTLRNALRHLAAMKTFGVDHLFEIEGLSE